MNDDTGDSIPDLTHMPRRPLHCGAAVAGCEYRMALRRLLGSVLLATTLTGAPPAHAQQLKNGAGPAVLSAVGRLSVPGVRYRDGYARHHEEACSATLLRLPADDAAAGDPWTSAIILTAWHCLEFYRDLSRDIVFSLETADGKLIARRARRLADGGGMHADWALLRLEQSVTLPATAAAGLGSTPPPTGAPVIMAGFSRRASQDTPGGKLSYDADCTITRPAGQDLQTDCRARKGASGGAVFAVRNDETQLLGVISRGDSDGLSIFVPLQRFSHRLPRVR